MAGPSFDLRRFDGLSLAETFDVHVLKDPDVVTAAALLPEHISGRDSVFREGRYPGLTIEYIWPLDVTAKNLAYQFVRRGFITSDAVIPKEVHDLSVIIVDRINDIRESLASGDLAGRGTFVTTGMFGEIDKLEWKRRNLSIDVQSSDLLEEQQYKPVVKWSGVSLHCSPAYMPAREEARQEQRQEKVGKGVPDGKKPTKHQASIAAAISSLWPQGIPPGLQVQMRDEMKIEWQRENGFSKSNSKTIYRHLKRK